MKRVLITGASGGIGRQAALTFGKEGDCVMLHYHKHQADARKTMQQMRGLGIDCDCVGADITDPVQVRQMFAAMQRRFGGIDVLINNAGISRHALLQDITDDDWQQMIAVNLSGTFYACREAAKEMIRQHKGRIINVSSVWGICGASCESHYSAAKAGVIGLSKALAQELGPSGITVNVVAPGAVDTLMNAGLTQEERAALCEQTPLGRFGTPQEIARAMLYLASDEAGFITGQVLSPNGGLVV